MALRVAMLKIAGENMGPMFGLRRWAHAVPLSPPMDSAFDRAIASQPLVIPEFDKINPGFFGGSMELMAVPKRKVSPHKRGIRNGPKALKPVPVIVRCKGCGRVKLPHFFCCSGTRGTDNGLMAPLARCKRCKMQEGGQDLVQALMKTGLEAENRQLKLS